MRHRRGCTGTPRLDQVTAVGGRRWYLYRCPDCGCVELRPHLNTTPTRPAQRRPNR